METSKEALACGTGRHTQVQPVSDGSGVQRVVALAAFIVPPDRRLQC